MAKKEKKILNRQAAPPYDAIVFVQGYIRSREVRAEFQKKMEGKKSEELVGEGRSAHSVGPGEDRADPAAPRGVMVEAAARTAPAPAARPPPSLYS